MNPKALAEARRRRGWTQKQAARRLRVSQPYLSLLETGRRSLTPSLARRARRLFALSPAFLPLPDLADMRPLPDNQAVAEDLAQLGYPGFAYLRTSRPAKNPAQVLLQALTKNNLEARLAEALPWLLLRYGRELDSDWLVDQARRHNLQNRLGFVVTLARQVAENTPELNDQVAPLKAVEDRLQESRLVKEDTLGESSLTLALRRWLQENRSPEAAYWNLLTGWRPEHLRYVP